MISEVIPRALDGERLDRVVAMLTGCTRAEAADAVASGTAMIDGRVVTKVSTKLREHQVVVVSSDPNSEAPPPQADASVEVRVVHEDPDVVVVDKPAGLVVHPGPGHQGATLVNGLLARYPEIASVGDPTRPGIVHRLDKGTSGLMVAARSDRAYDSLVDQLTRHDVERVYDALVWGHLETHHGTIDAPVGRSRRNPLLMTVSSDGREARTHYHVVDSFERPMQLSLLTCRLETGRTHQIRVHLRSIGRPVVGDELYGGLRPAIALSRPFLHARRLSFRHPGLDTTVGFDCAMPSELADILDGLE